jgi:hypothetical protein
MPNTTAAIMAIPSPLEPIRLVGTEDKHATLLYFGETSTLPGDAKQTLLDAVELASGMLFPFSESVVDVARLGSDVPPALVAMLTNENLAQVRNLFLMNPSVKGFLDNVQQRPSFTPHITLDYPDFTDEAILRALMRQIYRVRFDRLAVWWNDERLEFNLSALDGADMAMSEAIDKFLEHNGEDDADHLEHHGIKGMKWGVRRKPDPATGLVPRTSSADQISQDRILKKIKIGGIESVSNKDIQDYTRRLQLQNDLERALASQSAKQKEATDGFIKSFIKKQAGRQFDRVANKAIDVAIEAAINQAGGKIAGSNPELGKGVQDVAKRLKPKKG